MAAAARSPEALLPRSDSKIPPQHVEVSQQQAGLVDVLWHPLLTPLLRRHLPEAWGLLQFLMRSTQGHSSVITTKTKPSNWWLRTASELAYTH